MEVDPLLGKMVGDRFLVQAKLGEGGMGVVYKAEQCSIGRTVALKVLHPHLSQDAGLHARFQNEAAASSRLTHTNTITIYDFGRTSEGSLYIAMEFIRGRSLDEEILKNGPLEWRRVVHIGVQICGSLQDAHNNNIVHRDLKPENIMLCERSGDSDFVKVLDFGIAKILGDDSGDQRKNLTKTGMVFGTPQYMSPEQIRGEKVDHRSDIYSVGCILYEALAGVLPFTSETPMGVLTKHLMDTPPSFASHALPAAVPPAIEAVAMSALAKNAADRPQSMKSLAQALVDAAVSAGMTRPMTIQTSAMSPQSGPGPATTAVVAPQERSMAAVAPLPKPGGPSGALIGIIVGAALVVLAGGGLGWYFALGPGAAKDSKTTGVTTSQVPPPVEPPVLFPGQPNQAQAPVASAAADGNTASLPSVPVDSAKPTTSKASGGGATKPQMLKDANCNYSGSPDAVSAAMSANIRRAEPKIKECIKANLAKTTIAFEVKKDSSQPENLKVTSSSEMDACLRPFVAANFGIAADDERTGTATFTLGREKDAVHLCTINVTTSAKPTRPVIQIKQEDKPSDDKKPEQKKDKEEQKAKDTDGGSRPGFKIVKPKITIN
jgi:serine/threonine-protein kinase